ncbi:Tax4p KNAG_0B01910 [Huiozyma naganishii CBS 8797]|uniref:EH domain-containing protein n=1 Tax=Huiozyma naganishii (strain ATCC MYA-139 / BCRC 22969 / CBS 8797 / KCTC 17520 / NBRC 10181 / NCYC 3082 / Yp74L-3) TaxID=1071383 RepID=J7RGG1_HUIN7|nr:hypothetical protein KNAG_0B01910 [Kazachstania naganishii CBS 8797]CCK68633.1 hypothetical protein KNAG_0B01910 [Kazachstania naganishii CBS 8797]
MFSKSKKRSHTGNVNVQLDEQGMQDSLRAAQVIFQRHNGEPNLNSSNPDDSSLKKAGKPSIQATQQQQTPQPGFSKRTPPKPIPRQRSKNCQPNPLPLSLRTTGSASYNSSRINSPQVKNDNIFTPSSVPLDTLDEKLKISVEHSEDKIKPRPSNNDVSDCGKIPPNKSSITAAQIAASLAQSHIKNTSHGSNQYEKKLIVPPPAQLKRVPSVSATEERKTERNNSNHSISNKASFSSSPSPSHSFVQVKGDQKLATFGGGSVSPEHQHPNVNKKHTRIPPPSTILKENEEEGVNRKSSIDRERSQIELWPNECADSADSDSSCTSTSSKNWNGEDTEQDSDTADYDELYQYYDDDGNLSYEGEYDENDDEGHVDNSVYEDADIITANEPMETRVYAMNRKVNDQTNSKNYTSAPVPSPSYSDPELSERDRSFIVPSKKGRVRRLGRLFGSSRNKTMPSPTNTVRFKETMRYNTKKGFNEDKPWKKHRDVKFIDEQDRKRYEGVWVSNRFSYLNLLPWWPSSSKDDETGISTENAEYVLNLPQDGLILNLVVKDLWDRSNLPKDILMQIYKLIDTRKDGTLDRKSFIVGMWLVDQCLYGRKLPEVVPDIVWDSVDRYTMNMIQSKAEDESYQKRRRRRRMLMRKEIKHLKSGIKHVHL